VVDAISIMLPLIPFAVCKAIRKAIACVPEGGTLTFDEMESAEKHQTSHRDRPFATARPGRRESPRGSQVRKRLSVGGKGNRTLVPRNKETPRRRLPIS